MSKLLLGILLVCVLTSHTFSMEKHPQDVFVVQFLEKPDKDTRSKMKEMGLSWWNSSNTEWAGLSSYDNVQKFISEVSKKIKTITVMQYTDIPFLLRFEETPEEGQLRKEIKSLKFSWYNQHLHEWFGFPTLNTEQIKSAIKSYTNINFDVINLLTEIEKITCSTKESSEDSDHEDLLKESEIKFLVVTQKETISNDKLSSIFYKSEEEDFCNLAKILQKQSFNIGISIRAKGQKMGIGTIYLDVEQWEQEDKKQVEVALRKLDILEIVTKTPIMILPWILKFDNLNSLTVESPANPISNIEIDTSNINIANFKALREIQLYEGLYSNNESIKKYMAAVFAKLKENKKLKEFNIRENTVPIKEQVYQYYLANK